LTRLLIDTSVVIKWFHEAGEDDVVEARAILDAHVRGELDAHILDLAVYEVGNVLARALSWSAGDVADQLDDLLAITGPPIVMTQAWLRSAAALAKAHALSFYDASWAAAAAELAVPLVSSDRRLLTAGVAEAPADLAARLKLVR